MPHTFNRMSIPRMWNFALPKIKWPTFWQWCLIVFFVMLLSPVIVFLLKLALSAALWAVGLTPAARWVWTGSLESAVEVSETKAIEASAVQREPSSPPLSPGDVMARFYEGPVGPHVNGWQTLALQVEHHLQLDSDLELVRDHASGKGMSLALMEGGKLETTCLYGRESNGVFQNIWLITAGQLDTHRPTAGLKRWEITPADDTIHLQRTLEQSLDPADLRRAFGLRVRATESTREAVWIRTERQISPAEAQRFGSDQPWPFVSWGPLWRDTGKSLTVHIRFLQPDGTPFSDNSLFTDSPPLIADGEHLFWCNLGSFIVLGSEQLSAGENPLKINTAFPCLVRVVVRVDL